VVEDRCQLLQFFSVSKVGEKGPQFTVNRPSPGLKRNLFYGVPATSVRLIWCRFLIKQMMSSLLARLCRFMLYAGFRPNKSAAGHFELKIHMEELQDGLQN
jgi:hypothetical protein